MSEHEEFPLLEQSLRDALRPGAVPRNLESMLQAAAMDADRRRTVVVALQPMRLSRWLTRWPAYAVAASLLLVLSFLGAKRHKQHTVATERYAFAKQADQDAMAFAREELQQSGIDLNQP